MGTVDKQRSTVNGQASANPQASALGNEGRASARSHDDTLNHSALSSQAPEPARGLSHAHPQAELSPRTPAQSPSSRNETSSTDPIQASMADNRYPHMSAQYTFPWSGDFAGPSTDYSRYPSSTPTDTADEYDVLAHQQLVSRAMEQPFCAAQMPPAVTWAPVQSTQTFQHHQGSYQTSPFPTPSYSQFPFTQYSSPPVIASSPGFVPSSVSPYAPGPATSPYMPHGMTQARPIPIVPGSAASDGASSLSPEMISNASSLSESVGSHRAGPVRKQRKSEAGRDSSKQPARGGPMTDAAKTKADLVRDLGACWRCRRYKKSCDGPGECSNCMRGNFRVWPSSLGCRRGCLEELVAHLVPVQAQDYLAPASRLVLPQPNWRYGTIDSAQRQMIQEQLPMTNNWLRLSLKVQSTGMYGPEFQSLLDIVTKYQATQTRPNALLEASISLLDSTCDIYQNFVASAWPLPPADINAAIITAQRAYAGVSKMFLTSALSGRRRDWLPSFLSMCMAFCAVMIMMDAAVAVPNNAKIAVWGDVYEVSRDLRQRLYPVTTDLLRASSNGTKPFALGCWSVNDLVNQDGSIELVRSPEGMRMLGGDKAAFDGMRSLQEWIRRNIRLMDMGTKVIRSDPFTTPEVPAIAAILKLFDL